MDDLSYSYEKLMDLFFNQFIAVNIIKFVRTSIKPNKIMMLLQHTVQNTPQNSHTQAAHCSAQDKTDRQRKNFEQIKFSNEKDRMQVLSRNSGLKGCQRCQYLAINVKQLEKVSNELAKLQGMKSEIKQQIELLSANFMYILELVSTNIMSGVKSRVKQILVEKQKIIQKQQQIIKRLENQSLSLINKIDDHMEYQEKILILEQKVKQLSAQNLTFKNYGPRDSFKIQTKLSTAECSTDGYSGADNERSLSPSQNVEGVVKSVRTSNIISAVEKKKFTNSLAMSMKNPESPTIQKQSSPMKIQDLKAKISAMKQRLLNQKF